MVDSFKYEVLWIKKYVKYFIINKVHHCRKWVPTKNQIKNATPKESRIFPNKQQNQL